MSAQYFVACETLGSPGGDSAFQKAIGRLFGKLTALGYRFEDPKTESTEVQNTKAWFDKRRETEIRLFENKITHVRHLELTAADLAKVQDVADAIRTTLDLEDHEALLHAWAGAAIDAPNTVVKLALSAPDPMSDYAFDVIADALFDPSPAVRCHAAYAMAVSGDPDFVAPLRERRPLEDDVNALEIIDRALRMYGDGEAQL